MVRRLLLVLAGLLSFGAALARADGLPVLGFVGSAHGVAALNSQVRYLTRPAGRDTCVPRAERRLQRRRDQARCTGWYVRAAIDTRTLKLRPPARSVRRPAHAAVSSERQGSGALGTAVAIIAAFVLLAAATLLLRRRLVPISRAADAP